MRLTRPYRLFITVCWAAVIFAATGMPMPPTVYDFGFTLYDKAIHLSLFAIFAYLLIWALEDSKYRQALIYRQVLQVTVLFALSTEFYQFFVPNRAPDLPDLIAGTLGAGIAIFLDFVRSYRVKPKLLLHICCIGCGAYVSEVLGKDYEVTLYYYNPNIFPETEYRKRLEETKRIAGKFGIKDIEGEYGHGIWLEMVKGHEMDNEKGERCVMCYRDRLDSTARLAKEKGFKYFTTTLTISPHKDAKAVSSIGADLELKYPGVKFLDRDFKKKDGFKLSTKLSRELGLYRQDYCGCEFSRAYSKCEICQ